MLLSVSGGDSLVQSGDITEALSSYCVQSQRQPANWWAYYRAAWCFNLLDVPDSAEVYAGVALGLQPANERCLAELLKSLSEKPEEVLEYSYLVRGGGSCRYRFARAEMDLDLPCKSSLDWLENSFLSDIDSVAADAGCWLAILHGDSGLPYIERAVELMPEEEFYRCLYVDKLIDEGLLEEAIVQFGILKESGSVGLSFWQTAASLHEAMGDPVSAIESSRRAWEIRMTPSSAADLGWKLYFHGRDLIRNGMMSDAIPPLIESSNLWSNDSLWAVKSDSLLILINEFTSTSEGFGEPI